MLHDLADALGLTNSGLVVSLTFFLLISLKHWLIDYFLIGIERTPFRVAACTPSFWRTASHLCYLQGIATATIIFFLFGPDPQLIWLAVLDGLANFSYYALRHQHWQRSLFLDITYIRGIFSAEALRFALTAIITIVYFSAQKAPALTELIVYAAVTYTSAYFGASLSQVVLTKAIIYSIITFMGMSLICHLISQARTGKLRATQFSWVSLLYQLAFAFLVLDQAGGERSLFSTALAAACVSGTFYYGRVIINQASDQLERSVLALTVYVINLLLFIGLVAFAYAGYRPAS